MHRQPDHGMAYLLAELGTRGTLDGRQRLVVKGKLETEKFEVNLKRYCNAYVTCNACKSRVTSLSRENRLLLLRCKKKTGKITYNGHELHEFCVQRSSAYIIQTENNIAELTVRETLDFGARCEGEGFAGSLTELTRLEKENKICPSPEIDASMKITVFLKLFVCFLYFHAYISEYLL